jgi:hypothetical protein
MSLSPESVARFCFCSTSMWWTACGASTPPRPWCATRMATSTMCWRWWTPAPASTSPSTSTRRPRRRPGANMFFHSARNPLGDIIPVTWVTCAMARRACCSRCAALVLQCQRPLRLHCCPGCSYGQHLPSSGDLATEPPLLPPQANLTPLDLGLSPSDPWPEVQHSLHTFVRKPGSWCYGRRASLQPCHMCMTHPPEMLLILHLQTGSANGVCAGRRAAGDAPG